MPRAASPTPPTRKGPPSGKLAKAAREATTAEGDLSRYRENAGFLQDARAKRRSQGARPRPSLRHPKTRGAAASLRPSARTRRRLQELGGHERTEPRSAGQAAGRASRGSPHRLRGFRRDHPKRRIWRRHRHDLGSRVLAARRRSRERVTPRGISPSNSTAKSFMAAGISFAPSRGRVTRRSNGSSSSPAMTMRIRKRKRISWMRLRIRWPHTAAWMKLRGNKAPCGHLPGGWCGEIFRRRET